MRSSQVTTGKMLCFLHALPSALVTVGSESVAIPSRYCQDSPGRAGNWPLWQLLPLMVQPHHGAEWALPDCESALRFPYIPCFLLECRELNWAALNLSLAQVSQKCRPAHCHLPAKPVLIFLVQISITDAKKMSPRGDPMSRSYCVLVQ